MTRAYRWLTLAVAAGAVALALFARAPKPVPHPDAPAVASPAESLAIEIVNGEVRPERSVVPKGASVTLTIRNRDGAPRRLSLAAYEDRWSPGPISAGTETIVRFRADRPGADFAWLVDGRPSGVLVVAGPHLEEGHQ